MACIILKGPTGQRLIPENTPYRLLDDEALVGIEWACGPQLPGDAGIPTMFRKCSSCGELGVYEST
jgi:hypothetical protein